MSQTKLFLFGPPRVEQAGRAVEIGLRKALALLAHLAVTKQPHSRDILATLLWPERDQRSGRASLRRTAYRLNEALGRGFLAMTAETIGLDPNGGLWVDVDAYRDQVREDLPQDGGTGEPDDRRDARLAAAADLYGDGFLAGFTVKDSPGFDEWQFFEGEALRRSQVQVLTALIGVLQARRAFNEAVPYAQRWLALDPLHEPAHCHLMQLYAWSDQKAAAVRQYGECVRILGDELGVPPQPETTALYEAIRSADGAPEPASPFQRSRTRYAKGRDVHIAYQVIGSGPVDVVLIPGFVSHVELAWEEPSLTRFLGGLATFARVILFDRRGVGLSDRIGYCPGVDDTREDVLAVMDAVGCEQAILFGCSEGGPIAALTAALDPDRVAGLVLYGALPKGTQSEDYPWALTRGQYDYWLAQLMESWGGPSNIETYAPGRAGDRELRRWWAKLLRVASSPGAVKSVLEVLRDIDIRDVLPTIGVPTLVMHQTGDKAVRVEAGRYLARRIPGATFVELPGDDHWFWVGDSDAILREIAQFIKNP